MKKQFLEAIEEEMAEQQKQINLHTKHNITDNNIIVVEKSNMLKFSVKSISSLIRLCATIILLCLAALGLLCIVYPETREPMLNVIEQIYMQIDLLQFVNKGV